MMRMPSVRQRTLGESLDEMAAQLAVSSEALRKRRARAIADICRRLAA